MSEACSPSCRMGARPRGRQTPKRTSRSCGTSSIPWSRSVPANGLRPSPCVRMPTSTSARSCRPSGRPSSEASDIALWIFVFSIENANIRGPALFRTLNNRKATLHRPVPVMLLIAMLWPVGGDCGVMQAMPADSVVLQGGGPFMRLLGVPRFDTGLPAEGEALRLALDIVNHADRSDTASESIELDGESLYLDVAFRKAVTDRLSLGLAVPVINHSGGSLDHAIEAWHDLFGLSNAERAGPANELSIVYSDAG